MLVFALEVRNVYPSLFITVSVIQTTGRLSRLVMKWAQSVRDTEYLVDLRLQNMDDPIDGTAKPVIQRQSDGNEIDGVPVEVIGKLLALAQHSYNTRCIISKRYTSNIPLSQEMTDKSPKGI